MQMNNTGMVEHIVNEFQKRKLVNPAYSLRSFSKDIGVDQSLMTKIIKGKRKVSVDLSMRLTNLFNLEAPVYSQEA